MGPRVVTQDSVVSNPKSVVNKGERELGKSVTVG